MLDYYYGNPGVNTLPRPCIATRSPNPQPEVIVTIQLYSTILTLDQWAH